MEEATEVPDHSRHSFSYLDPAEQERLQKEGMKREAQKAVLEAQIQERKSRLEQEQRQIDKAEEELEAKVRRELLEMGTEWRKHESQPRVSSPGGDIRNRIYGPVYTDPYTEA